MGGGDSLAKVIRHTVMLDRRGGKKLGIRIEGAKEPTSPVRVTFVTPGAQADGVMFVGDTIHYINGHSVVGMSKMEATRVIAGRDTVEMLVSSAQADHPVLKQPPRERRSSVGRVETLQAPPHETALP